MIILSVFSIISQYQTIDYQQHPQNKALLLKTDARTQSSSQLFLTLGFLLSKTLKMT
jgi:hypothetical protein